MHLVASSLAHYLLSRGHITHESIVDGDFCVTEILQRNRNFKVTRGHRVGLFVKQVRESDEGLIETLRREALCYRTVQSRPEYAPLATLMPQFVDYDPQRHVLIVELLPDAENLIQYHGRLHRFPVEIGALMGTQLGTYHSEIGRRMSTQPDAEFFPRQPPWILTLPRQDVAMLRLYRAPNAPLVAILNQFPDFRRWIEELLDEWRPDSLIHGDIKFPNGLVTHGPDGTIGFRLVDWELTDYGDSAWDVGGVLQSYLDFWIESMPFRTESDPRQFASQARYTIESMQPAIRAFWDSYVATRGFSVSEADTHLLRCVRFGAARMVQTAFETTEAARQLQRNGITMLQVSMNILRNPRDAARDLFGLGVG